MGLLYGTRRTLVGGARIPTYRFDPTTATFTAKAAKRNGAGPFGAGPITQGRWDTNTLGDRVSFDRTTQIASNFYATFDPYQGTMVAWITPEWNGNDGLNHYIYYGATSLRLYKNTSNNIQFQIEAGGSVYSATASAAAWTAGTTYCIVGRWDLKNKLDGTNYMCLSINDVHTFGAAAIGVASTPGTAYLGAVATLVGHTLIEGLTIYRRPLWDGAYGCNVGNGDEVALVYAAGAGKDSCEVTGSWDACFCLPTNATVGELVTGTGEAWSHPHNGAVLTDTYMQTAYAASAWADEGTPITPVSLAFNGSTTVVNCGSGATLDDLHYAAFTVEAWVRLDYGGSSISSICSKRGAGASGWQFLGINSVGIQGNVFGVTTTAATYTGASAFRADNRWHHVAMTYNDAGDRKVYLWIDGIAQNYSQIATVGAVISDASSDLMISSYVGNQYFWKGAIGWVRLSNSIRYAAPFTPPSRHIPPAPDANTVEQWNLNEGAGTTATAQVTTPGNDGTITAGSWNILKDMSTDAPGARLFNWGYSFGADAADEGITQTKTGLTPGADYYLQVMAHTDAATAMNVYVYDETNAAAILDYDGGASATRTAPWVAGMGFELPALCTSISTKVRSTASGPTAYVHQALLLPNLWDDPGMETGTAPTNVGTPTSSAQDAGQAHTGTNSWKVVADAADEGIKRAITTTAGKYYHASAYVYALTAGTVDMEGPTGQDGAAARATTTVNDAWQRLAFVFRATGASTDLQFTSNAAQTFYVDDVGVIAENDITLTVTPASQANSTQTDGLRVDGRDTLSATTAGFTATSWAVEWKWTQRHAAADVAKFGVATPYIVHVWGNATNYASVYWSAANTVTLEFNDGGGLHSTTWDATGAIVAGTQYTGKVECSASAMVFKVNGVVKATITTAISYATPPTTVYAGHKQDGTLQLDAAFAAP